MRLRRTVPVFALVLMWLSGCSSLSPQVRTAAVEFSSVYEEFGNQVLLANVLRAKDRAPLSFSDLPTISGAISTKASASLSVPFGPLHGSDARRIFAPGFEFSSSPTFDTHSINSQAFTLNLMQPVSPGYIRSLWDAGVDHRMLLFLLVESIELPSNIGTRFIRNDPDYAREFRKFATVVSALTAKRPELRSFTVVEPIGPPIAASAPGRAASGPIGDPVAVDIDKFVQLAQLDPKTFHFDVVRGESQLGFRLYRRYPGQSVLCADLQSASARLAEFPVGHGRAEKVIEPPHSALFDKANSAKSSPMLAQETERARARLLDFARSWPVPSFAPSLSTSGWRGASLGLSLANATALVETGSTSILLDPAHCPVRDVVIPEASNVVWKDGLGMQATDLGTVGFVHWRSPANIFRFLGALLRSDIALEWEETTDDVSRRHVLFAVKKSDRAEITEPTRIAVHQASALFYVPQVPEDHSRRDHTLEVFSVLSQLVNTSKHAEDLPVPRTLQVLP